MRSKRILRAAFVDTLPVLAGYAVLGLGFGMVLVAKGLPALCAAVMSLFIYAGSMQFVGVELMCAGSGYAAIALTTLLVNARHLFYGISMVDRYKGAGAEKPYLIFALTDETYSLAVREIPYDGEERRGYYFWISLLDQIYWVSGCAIGAVLGEILPINTQGMDFALTALFVSIVTDQWKQTKNHIPALLGFGVSLICLILFGADDFLIPAMLGLCVSLFACRSIIEKEAKKP